MSWIVMCELNAKNAPQINAEYVPLLSKIIEIMLLLLSNKVHLYICEFADVI